MILADNILYGLLLLDPDLDRSELGGVRRLKCQKSKMSEKCQNLACRFGGDLAAVVQIT